MPAELVTVDTMIRYLDPESDKWSSEEKTVIQEILDATEDTLERETGQVFTASTDAITDEPHDGSGTRRLYVNRPIDSLAAVKLGRDKGTTLDVGDVDVLVFWSGRRKIERIGADFPVGVRNAWVSYTPLAQLPAVAIMAVKEIAAKIWKNRGREHVSSIRTDGGLSETVAHAVARSTTWELAVEQLMIPALG